MSDLAREIADTVVRIKTEMRKASFASRSEAGRYAANQRWKGQGKKGKTAVDDGLSIRGMTPAKRDADELRTYIDEQEGLLESMQGSASKAELKQQKGLITLARRDLRRMEGSETKVEPKTPKSNKNISRQEASAVERVDLFMRSTANLDQSVLDRMADKYKTDPVSDADRKLLDETKKEMLDAGEAAKTAIQDAFAGGGRGPVDKLGKTFTSSSRKTARQMVEEGLERKSPTDPKPETTIRGTILQTKRMVFDRLALQLKDIPEALTASYGVGKAQFASRSEAGRYAANMRWQGQGQASAASAGSSLKHKVDFKVMSSGRFTHVQGQGFDGQVKYMIGNENEFPDDMDYGFAFSMPGEGFIHAAILKSGFSQKVMSNRNHTPSLDEIKNRTVELNQELGQAVSDHLKTLNIREIATGIEKEYTRADKTIPRAVANAITSMKSMRNINDVQGYATGQKVVSRAVKDLATFDTEVGKLVKTELRDRVKNASPKPPTAGLRRANSLPFDELRSN